MANKPKKRLRFDLSLTSNDNANEVLDYKLIIEKYPFGQVHLAQSIRKLIDSQAGFLNLPLGRVQPEGSNCKAADLRFACVGNSPVAAEHL